MKRGTTEHPKFGALCMRLGLDDWEGIGLLEAVWLFTGRFARRGDIGKWTDEQIARGVRWQRTEPAEVIAALVAEGWLDEHPTMRLVVHDWIEHCDDSIHMSLARSSECFWDGTIPKMNRLTLEERKVILKKFRALGIRSTNALVRTARRRPDLTSPDLTGQATGEKNGAESGAVSPEPSPSNGNGKHADSQVPLTPEELMAGWNELCVPLGLPVVREVRDSRRADVLRRLREHPNLSFWQSVFRAIPKQQFLLGKNERGWKVNFDFLFANDRNATKVAEMQYGK